MHADDQVDRDTGEPVPDRQVPVLIARERLECLEEGLRGDVFGLRNIVHPTEGEGEDRMGVPFVEDPEGFGVRRIRRCAYRASDEGGIVERPPPRGLAAGQPSLDGGVVAPRVGAGGPAGMGRPRHERPRHGRHRPCSRPALPVSWSAWRATTPRPAGPPAGTGLAGRVSFHAVAPCATASSALLARQPGLRKR